MNQNEFLAQVGGYLDTVGIPYMIVGSIASSFHSQPRNTNDVDIVIDPTPEQLDAFLALLGTRFYFSRDAAHDALRRRSMFNIIHLSDGWKADLIVRKQRPFSVEELHRRTINLVDTRLVPLASAEDTILTKLEWNAITRSERQVRDALNVAIAQWPTLDLIYLRKWAPELGVAAALEEVLRAAEETQPPTSP